MNQPRSGPQRAQDNVALLETYLAGLRERGDSLPTTATGDVNLSKVAEESGIGDRGRFYTNQRLKTLLADAVKSLTPATSEPVPHLDSGRKSRQSESGNDNLKRAERRVNQLEQANAVLVAENAELRRQLRDTRLRMGREDMIIETGRRVVAPPEE